MSYGSKYIESVEIDGIHRAKTEIIYDIKMLNTRKTVVDCSKNRNSIYK